MAEDRDGVREVMAPSGRLVPPGDAAAFAAAIADLSADREALAAAAAAARQHMQDHHGVNAASERIDAALKSFL